MSTLLEELENESIIIIEPKRKLSSFVIPDNTHFIRHFLNNKSKKNLNTAKAYEIDIKQFFRVSCVEDISLNMIKTVTIYDAEDYVADLMDKGLASTTIHRKVTSLSSLYQWLLRYQDNSRDITLLKFNPFAGLKDIKPSLSCKEAEFLTRDEAADMLKAIDTKKIVGLRNKAIIGLALSTGLRKSEIINIKIGDITKILGFDVIRVIRKRNKDDIIKLNSHVKSLIMEYIRRTNRSIEADADDYLFKSHSTNTSQCKEKLNPATLNKMLAKQCKILNIKHKLRVHSLRHSAITMVIQKGADLSKAQLFAGHESGFTTARYIHSIKKLEDSATDLIDVFE